MNEQTTDRALKSVPLTPDEAAGFEAWVKDQHTKIDAAEKLGVQRGTIDRVLAFKTGSPETIKKIKAVIGVLATAS